MVGMPATERQVANSFPSKTPKPQTHSRASHKQAPPGEGTRRDRLTPPVATVWQPWQPGRRSRVDTLGPCRCCTTQPFLSAHSMNPEINDQRAPSLRSGRPPPPILSVGNVSRDLSNLCLAGREEPAQPRRSSSSSSKKKGSLVEPSFQRYPSCRNGDLCDDGASSQSSEVVDVDGLFSDARVPQAKLGRSPPFHHRDDGCVSPPAPQFLEEETEEAVNGNDEAPPRRARGPSIDLDRFDDWIVEPLNLAEHKERQDYPHQQHTESTADETADTTTTNPSEHSPRRPPVARFPSQELLSLARPPPPPPPLDCGNWDSISVPDYALPPACASSPSSPNGLNSSAGPPPPPPPLAPPPRRALGSSANHSGWLNPNPGPSPPPHHPSFSEGGQYVSHHADHRGGGGRGNSMRTEPQPLYVDGGGGGHQYRPHPDSPTPPAPLVEIEVSPGEFLPLRGSRETLHAIETGQSQKVSCLSCGTLLACVNDCLMVICPVCKCISPTPREDDSNTIWLRVPNDAGGGDDCHSGSSGNWWEGEDDNDDGCTSSFLSGYAARHRQEVRRRATLSVSSRPKRGVGLGLQAE